MFCNHCGTELNEGVNYCSKCGNSITPAKKSIDSEPTIRYHESGRGTLILIMGIFSFIFGPFLGIPAWVMGSSDLNKIRNGIIEASEKTKTKIGMILGIITTLLVPFIVIFSIATVVGINVFNASSSMANRDALIADLTNIAAMSQQYYRKPSNLGGGGKHFTAWKVPESLSQTENMSLPVTAKIESQVVTLVGVGKEIGNDGSGKVMVTMVVGSDRILSTTVNN